MLVSAWFWVSRLNADAVAIVPAALRISPDCTLSVWLPIKLPALLSSKPAPSRMSAPCRALTTPDVLFNALAVMPTLPLDVILPRILVTALALTIVTSLRAETTASVALTLDAWIDMAVSDMTRPDWLLSAPAPMVRVPPASSAPRLFDSVPPPNAMTASFPAETVEPSLLKLPAMISILSTAAIRAAVPCALLLIAPARMVMLPPPRIVPLLLVNTWLLVLTDKFAPLDNSPPLLSSAWVLMVVTVAPVIKPPLLLVWPAVTVVAPVLEAMVPRLATVLSLVRLPVVTVMASRATMRPPVLFKLDESIRVAPLAAPGAVPDCIAPLLLSTAPVLVTVSAAAASIIPCRFDKDAAVMVSTPFCAPRATIVPPSLLSWPLLTVRAPSAISVPAALFKVPAWVAMARSVLADITPPRLSIPVLTCTPVPASLTTWPLALARLCPVNARLPLASSLPSVLSMAPAVLTVSWPLASTVPLRLATDAPLKLALPTARQSLPVVSSAAVALAFRSPLARICVFRAVRLSPLAASTALASVAIWVPFSAMLPACRRKSPDDCRLPLVSAMPAPVMLNGPALYMLPVLLTWPAAVRAAPSVLRCVIDPALAIALACRPSLAAESIVPRFVRAPLAFTAVAPSLWVWPVKLTLPAPLIWMFCLA